MLVSTRVNRNHIRAALITAGKTDGRYYINTVMLEIHPNNVQFVVSTDGARMSVFRDDADHGAADVPAAGFKVNIPRTLAESVKAYKLVDTVGITFDTETEQITIDDCGSITGAKATDGRFPDWRRVVPATTGPIEPAHFQVSLIGDIAKMAKALGIKEIACMVYPQGAGCGIVAIVGCPGFRGIIMPLRADKLPAIPSMAGFSSPTRDECLA